MFTNGLPVIEPIAVPDVFISGVACCEPLGNDLFRLTHYAAQRCPETGRDVAVIVSRLIATTFTLYTGRDYVFREVEGVKRLLAS